MRVQIGKSALGLEGPAVRVARTTTSGQRWKRPAPVTYQMVRAHIAPQDSGRRGTAAAVGAAGDRLAHPAPHGPDRGRPSRPEGGPGPLLRTGQGAGQVRGFGEILTDRLGSTLPTWIDAVDASQLPGLPSFALHLHRDFDPVTAGLTLDWNSGSIEGAVNRIKKIKRQLYGRAGFELLRKMISLRWLSRRRSVAGRHAGGQSSVVQIPTGCSIGGSHN
ncbi:transposase [Streptomyces sp. NPDC059999]|uniref:transposase n=1 Tax=Streptomyces sp. NPDC059999 TaxID=3347030 RepID=UPI0036D00B99